MGDTPVQGPSGGLSGAGYLHEVIPARQTPPVRSQSARALVAGDADGLLPADSLLPADEHPLAARAPNATIEMSQCFIFVCHLSSRFPSARSSRLPSTLGVVGFGHGIARRPAGA
jgi:hypothetical protein